MNTKKFFISNSRLLSKIVSIRSTKIWQNKIYTRNFSQSHSILNIDTSSIQTNVTPPEQIKKIDDKQNFFWNISVKPFDENIMNILSAPLGIYHTFLRIYLFENRSQ